MQYAIVFVVVLFLLFGGVIKFIIFWLIGSMCIHEKDKVEVIKARDRTSNREVSFSSFIAFVSWLFIAFAVLALFGL